MGKQSTKWAVRTLGEVSISLKAPIPGLDLKPGPAVVALRLDIKERETGEVREFYFLAPGVSMDLGGKVAVTSNDPDWVEFRTEKPYEFSDFEGLGTRAGSIQVGLGIGWSYSFLNFWGIDVDQSWWRGDEIDTSGMLYSTGGTGVSYYFGMVVPATDPAFAGEGNLPDGSAPGAANEGNGNAPAPQHPQWTAGIPGGFPLVDPGAAGPSLLSMGLDFLPFVGTAKAADELVTGRDRITGDNVPFWAAILGVLPLGKLSKLFRHADDAADVLRHADDSLDVTRHGGDSTTLSIVVDHVDDIGPGGHGARSAAATFDGPAVRATVGPDNSVTVQIEGLIGDPIPRQNLENYYTTGAEVGLDGYHRAHLFGPRFGDEVADGIMLAPAKVNLVWESEVEQLIQDAHQVAKQSGSQVGITASVTSHPRTAGMPDLLKNAEYRMWLQQPDGTRKFVVEVHIEVGLPGTRSAESPVVDVHEWSGWSQIGQPHSPTLASVSALSAAEGLSTGPATVGSESPIDFGDANALLCSGAEPTFDIADYQSLDGGAQCDFDSAFPQTDDDDPAGEMSDEDETEDGQSSSDDAPEYSQSYVDVGEDAQCEIDSASTQPDDDDTASETPDLDDTDDTEDGESSADDSPECSQPDPDVEDQDGGADDLDPALEESSGEDDDAPECDATEVSPDDSGGANDAGVDFDPSSTSSFDSTTDSGPHGGGSDSFDQPDFDSSAYESGGYEESNADGDESLGEPDYEPLDQAEDVSFAELNESASQESFASEPTPPEPTENAASYDVDVGDGGAVCADAGGGV